VKAGSSQKELPAFFCPKEATEWRTMVELTQEEFLKLFCPEVQRCVLTAVKRYKPTHLVCYENITLDAAGYGARTPMAVGPHNTMKTLKDTRNHWMHDELEKRQYPYYYAKVTR